MKLKKAKMRGLDSFGMLCSAEELGIDAKLLLPEQRNGISSCRRIHRLA